MNKNIIIAVPNDVEDLKAKFREVYIGSVTLVK